MGKADGKGQKPRAGKRRFRTLGILTGLVIAAFIVLILAFQFLHADMQALADKYRDTWEVIPILVGVYLLKACTVVLVPQPLVYLLTGLMFSPVIAFLLTLVFLSMEFTMDYAVGKKFGQKLMERLTRWLKGRNKFLDRLLDDRTLDNFTFIAAMRLMPGISTDSVSLIAGAKGIRFNRFFIASMVGCLPQAITVTLMGSAAEDPLSPEFLVPFAVLIVVLGVALLVKRRMSAKTTGEAAPKRKEESTNE